MPTVRWLSKLLGVGSRRCIRYRIHAPKQCGKMAYSAGKHLKTYYAQGVEWAVKTSPTKRAPQQKDTHAEHPNTCGVPGFKRTHARAHNSCAPAGKSWRVRSSGGRTGRADSRTRTRACWGRTSASASQSRTAQNPRSERRCSRRRRRRRTSRCTRKSGGADAAHIHAMPAGQARVSDSASAVTGICHTHLPGAVPRGGDHRVGSVTPAPAFACESKRALKQRRPVNRS